MGKGDGGMMAFKRLKKMGWPMAIGLCLLCIHMLGLYVAPMRTELRETEKEIRERKSQIAYLEAEISARASLDRLNLYNELLYGYAAPRPDQYLNGEQALASLGVGAPKSRAVMASVAEGMEEEAPLAGAIGGVDESFPELSMPVPTKNAAPTGERAQAELRRTERMAAIDRQLLAEEALDTITVEDAPEGDAE